MTTPLQLRTATPADLDAVQRLVESELFLPDVSDFHWHLPATIAHEIDRGGYFVVVADPVIVAVLNLVLREDGVWIEVIAVDPDHRRQGIARGLVRFADRVARHHGLDRVRVSTFRQYRVEQVYQRLGFRIFDQDDDCTWLEQPVAPAP